MVRYILRIVNLPAQLMRSEEEVAPATKLQNLATAIGGAQQIATGQGSPESAAATGRAAADVIPTIAQMAQRPQ
jgi:hypothetical protein